MSDYIHKYTDEELSKLEDRIYKVYKEAADSVDNTVNQYFKSFEKRDAEQKELVESGEITKDYYTQWRLNQIGRGQRYESLRDRLANRYENADEVAMSYVNDKTPGIYSLSRNYTAYTIEKTGANVSYNLWDEQTVRRLIVDNPSLMPYYPGWKAVDRGFDLAYGKQQISSVITSDILQGKNINQIARDLMTHIPNMDRNSAIRTARTAFTSAENGGRQAELENAWRQGADVWKEWIATRDNRTRPAHKMADGQKVRVNDFFIVGGEALLYPGDDSHGASGENLYNCRCTMKGVINGQEAKDYSEQSYEAWLNDKS